MIRVCLAGATGWAGSELARAFPLQADLTLVAAVSRSQAGRKLGDAPIYASAAEALRHQCDVFVEYTSPEVAKANILAALAAGPHVVVGTSGLTDADYFALTAVLLQRFAAMAAKIIPQWEILDYADDAKRDTPVLDFSA